MFRSTYPVPTDASNGSKDVLFHCLGNAKRREINQPHLIAILELPTAAADIDTQNEKNDNLQPLDRISLVDFNSTRERTTQKPVFSQAMVFPVAPSIALGRKNEET